MGPAVFVSIAQLIFTNELSSRLKSLSQGITPAYIAEHGLGDIIDGIPSKWSDKVLDGINWSLTHTWFLAVALACMTIMGSLTIEWRSVKQKQS